MPHFDQTAAAVFGVNEAAAMMPLKAVADGFGEVVENFPLDAHLAHPFDGRVRFAYQEFCQFRYRTAPGYAHDVGIKIVRGVGRQVDFGKLTFRNMRQERLLIDEAVVHMAKLRAVAKPSVAAFLFFRRFFQHQHFCSGDMGGAGSGLGGVAETDNDHIVIFCFHKLSF